VLAWVARRGSATLSVEGSMAVRGNKASLIVSVVDEDIPTTTLVPIRASGGITGRFGSVLVTSRRYKADVVYRPTEIQVTVTPIAVPRRGQQALPPNFTWPPGGPLAVPRQ